MVLRDPSIVIPAKAGIHGLTYPRHAPFRCSKGTTMDSRFRGDDKMFGSWSAVKNPAGEKIMSPERSRI